MNNYEVNIKLEKTIFVEDVCSEEEAIKKATDHFHNLLVPGIVEYARITTLKTNSKTFSEVIISKTKPTKLVSQEWVEKETVQKSVSEGYIRRINV